MEYSTLVKSLHRLYSTSSAVRTKVEALLLEEKITQEEYDFIIS